MSSGVSKIHILAILIIFLVIFLDQISKITAIKYLKGKPHISFPQTWYPNDLFRLTYTENTGAFLSLGSQLSENLRFWIFTVLNTLVIIILAGILIFNQSISLQTILSFSFIIGGGIGNIIDRILRDGKVVDFMNVGIGIGSWSIRTGIFNVADLAIMLGIVILIVGEIFLSTAKS